MVAELGIKMMADQFAMMRSGKLLGFSRKDD